MPIYFDGPKRVYQPAQIPFLGIYSRRHLSKTRVAAFVAFIASAYKCDHINLPMKMEGFPELQFQKQDYYSKITFQQAPDQIDLGTFSQLDYCQKYVRLEQCNRPEEIANFMKVSHTRTYRPHMIHAAHRFMYQCMHRGIGSGYKVVGRYNRVLGYDHFVYSHGSIWNSFHFYKRKAIKRSIDAYVLHILLANHTDQYLRAMLRSNGTSDIDQTLGFVKKFNFLVHRH